MKEFRLGASQHCHETSSSNVCSFSVDFKARARCYPKSALSCAADTVQRKDSAGDLGVISTYSFALIRYCPGEETEPRLQGSLPGKDPGVSSSEQFT